MGEHGSIFGEHAGGQSPEEGAGSASPDGKQANEIKSIYGRDNFIEWIYRMADNNAVTVLNEKKAEALLRDVEESYSQPVAYADDLTKIILAQEKAEVKKTYE